MSDIVSTQDSNEVLLNNPFYNDLGEIMSNPTFVKFFDKYFNAKEDIQSTLLYMKLYRAIQQKYKHKKGIEIDKLTNLSVINYIMNDAVLRSSVVKAMTEHYGDDSKIKKAISDTNLILN